MNGGITVQYYSVSLLIYDIDAALGYIFSACPLPLGATSADTYLPLLAIYCKFMKLLRPDGSKLPPTVAHVAIGAVPGSGGVEVITFGSTIRGPKGDLQKKRLELLKAAFNTSRFEENSIGQTYGHCAETYPYLCNIDRYADDHIKKFTNDSHIWKGAETSLRARSGAWL